MWCVVKSKARPGLCLLRRSQVALRAYGSIPEVGSSRMTISEPPIRAMATLQMYAKILINNHSSVRNLSVLITTVMFLINTRELSHQLL